MRPAPRPMRTTRRAAVLQRLGLVVRWPIVFECARSLVCTRALTHLLDPGSQLDQLALERVEFELLLGDDTAELFELALLEREALLHFDVPAAWHTAEV